MKCPMFMYLSSSSVLIHVLRNNYASAYGFQFGMILIFFRSFILYLKSKLITLIEDMNGEVTVYLITDIGFWEEDITLLNTSSYIHT